MNNSAGTLSRTVSRISNSLPDGTPVAASSVPSKKLAMRLYCPEKSCRFISSKSKAKLKARRTRGSWNFGRRMLKAKACMTPELRMSNSSRTTFLSRTAGKSYEVAQSLALFSVRQST